MQQAHIVLIVSGDLSNAEKTQIENYEQIETIFTYTVSADGKDEFHSIYAKKDCRNYLNTLIRLLKQFWFFLGLLIVMTCAYAYPPLARSGGPIRAEYTIGWGCVIIIFLLSGLGLKTSELKHDIFYFRMHLFIQLFSLVLIPFTVYGICLLLAKSSMNTVLVAGIVIMSCTSTTISSNVVMTKNAGGNESGALLGRFTTAIRR
ncbi:unnamed protein product [Rotaria sordida]|uniref:Uncharacterized protein n=1 Tax=Rotaria sordida TaxID=392033 RepID=A0A814STL9_9BILA|nr:unnamed protein product [Rotaria sordida]CAF1394544.1 unnamed protein product [Rotaria sordida]